MLRIIEIFEAIRDNKDLSIFEDFKIEVKKSLNITVKITPKKEEDFILYSLYIIGYTENGKSFYKDYMNWEKKDFFIII